MTQLNQGDSVKIVLEIGVDHDTNTDSLESAIYDLLKSAVMPTLGAYVISLSLTKMRG